MNGDKELDALVSALQNAVEIHREVQRLRKIERWARNRLPVKEGTEVVLIAPVGIGPGWVSYSALLVPGRTGTISGFYLRDNLTWGGLFTPEEAFYFSDYHKCFAKCRHQKSFMISLSKFRPRKKKDKALGYPADTREYGL